VRIEDRALPAAGAATARARERERDTSVAAAGMLGLPGFRVVAVAEHDGELQVQVETTDDLVGCPSCAAVAVLHDGVCAWCGTCPPGVARCCCAGRSGCGAAGTAPVRR